MVANAQSRAIAIRSIPNYSRLNQVERSYSSFDAITYRREPNSSPSGFVNLRETRISTNSPFRRLTGLTMVTSSAGQRTSGTDAVTGFRLDRGIYSRWRFIGSTASDSLFFGPQATIIDKRSGGFIDFGRDNVRDTFTFTNQINVDKCSQKHKFRCSPLNHLQRVRIVNFGREDVINLQGKIYGYDNVRNGVIPGIESARLSISVIPELA